MEKISYERRVYESVDDKNLCRSSSQKSTEIKFMQQRVKTSF